MWNCGLFANLYHWGSVLHRLGTRGLIVWLHPLFPFPLCTLFPATHFLYFFLWGGKTHCTLIATPNADNANRRQKKGKS
jgi:hypothetical protein